MYQAEGGLCDEMIATLVSREIWINEMYLLQGWIKNLEVICTARLAFGSVVSEPKDKFLDA